MSLHSSTESTAPARRASLPAPGERFVTDAGLETELVFHDGLELPEFSAAPLLDRPEGRERLRRYYEAFVALAERHKMGLILETPTWRISADWSERLGYDREGRRRLNHAGVGLLADLRERATLEPSRFVVSGNLGPRGDGYALEEAIGAEEAERYHAEQIGDLADAGADVVTALTLTSSPEALGIARAAAARGIPAVISFTVETDGRLPSGEPLGDAIATVDAAAPVVYFGINCAHPSHFAATLREGGDWTHRIGALRSNASKKSHAELDGCETLDIGDPAALARDTAELMPHLPNLRVFGGCCGTDLRHVTQICEILGR